MLYVRTNGERRYGQLDLDRGRPFRNGQRLGIRFRAPYEWMPRRDERLLSPRSRRHRARAGRVEIEILIPGDQAAFHVTYRTADGRRQRAFVRGAQVSVIPGQPASRRLMPASIRHARDHSGPELLPPEGPRSARFRRARAGRAVCHRGPIHAGTGEHAAPRVSDVEHPQRGVLELSRWSDRGSRSQAYSGPCTTRHAYAGLPPHKLNRVEAYIREHFAETIQIAATGATSFI